MEEQRAPKRQKLLNISQPRMEVVTSLSTSKEVTLKLPSHASWFKLDTISEIEKNSLFEFFSGEYPSKTSEIYKEYRDFMVLAYQQNPGQYLSQTACRRNLAGDVCAILRVHEFLEHWGLINFYVNPDLSIDVRPNVSADELIMKSVIDLEANHFKSASSLENANSLALHKESFSKAFIPPSVSATHTCCMCSVDCSPTWYNCEKNKCDICPSCYYLGRFPELLDSSNFVRMDAPLEYEAGEWTEQETLLLLEGIERFGEDWNAVSQHVGTKTRTQCVLHFLRLPIEDPYLEDQLNELHKAKSETAKDDLPFLEADNPIMSLIAFLASSVNPTVAAAAAKAALTEFLKQRKEEHLKKAAKKVVDLEKDEKEDKTKSEVFTKENIRTVASAALAGAVIKAQLLAERDEREMHNCMTELIELQMKKIELKLKGFQELQQAMEREKTQIELARQQLTHDHKK